MVPLSLGDLKFQTGFILDNSSRPVCISGVFSVENPRVIVLICAH